MNIMSPDFQTRVKIHLLIQDFNHGGRFGNS
jgi:hypothetical protein